MSEVESGGGRGGGRRCPCPSVGSGAPAAGGFLSILAPNFAVYSHSSHKQDRNIAILNSQFDDLNDVTPRNWLIIAHDLPPPQI